MSLQPTIRRANGRKVFGGRIIQPVLRMTVVVGITIYR